MEGRLEVVIILVVRLSRGAVIKCGFVRGEGLMGDVMASNMDSKREPCYAR